MKWNEYTWYSKWATILFFVVAFPALVLYIGSEYASTKTYLEKISIKEPAVIPNNNDTIRSLKYTNNQYGFALNLDADWKGYSVEEKQWSGVLTGKTISGPLISITYPDLDIIGQAIPVMVFTQEEWKLIASEQMSVGAAPMPPRELGRNMKYVFAIPARYNYSFPVGYEEVDKIVNDQTRWSFFEI